MTIKLCDSVNDTNCFWRHIKCMSRKGNVIDKSKITGSDWNNYFKELLNNDVNIVEDFKTMTDDFVRQHNELCNACDTKTVDFLNDKISRIEIIKAIDSLINVKAEGDDGIVGEMLKISKYVLILHLFILFNNILEMVFIRTAGVRPFYANCIKWFCNEDRNYRSISFLPVLGKVFTKILNNRLVKRARNHNLKKRAVTLQLIKYLAYKRCVKNTLQKRRGDFLFFLLTSPNLLIPYLIICCGIS